MNQARRADLGGRRLDPLGRARADRHPRALAHQLGRDGLPDALRRARHERDLPAEAEVHGPTLPRRRSQTTSAGSSGSRASRAHQSANTGTPSAVPSQCSPVSTAIDGRDARERRPDQHARDRQAQHPRDEQRARDPRRGPREPAPALEERVRQREREDHGEHGDRHRLHHRRLDERPATSSGPWWQAAAATAAAPGYPRRARAVSSAGQSTCLTSRGSQVRALHRPLGPRGARPRAPSARTRLAAMTTHVGSRTIAVASEGVLR